MVNENNSYGLTFSKDARAVQLLRQIEIFSVSTAHVAVPKGVKLSISDDVLAEAMSEPQVIAVQTAKINLADELSLARHFAEFADDDKMLANLGIDEYKAMLADEDQGE